MGFFFRQGVIFVLFGMLLFCVSCEKHPIGQMPEVQREQSDPAKTNWSEKSEMEKSESAPQQPQEVPHEGR